MESFSKEERANCCNIQLYKAPLDGFDQHLQLTLAEEANVENALPTAHMFQSLVLPEYKSVEALMQKCSMHSKFIRISIDLKVKINIRTYECSLILKITNLNVLYSYIYIK